MARVAQKESGAGSKVGRWGICRFGQRRGDRPEQALRKGPADAVSLGLLGRVVAGGAGRSALASGPRPGQRDGHQQRTSQLRPAPPAAAVPGAAAHRAA